MLLLFRWSLDPLLRSRLYTAAILFFFSWIGLMSCNSFLISIDVSCWFCDFCLKPSVLCFFEETLRVKLAWSTVMSTDVSFSLVSWILSILWSIVSIPLDFSYSSYFTSEISKMLSVYNFEFFFISTDGYLACTAWLWSLEIVFFEWLKTFSSRIKLWSKSALIELYCIWEMPPSFC